MVTRMGELGREEAGQQEFVFVATYLPLLKAMNIIPFLRLSFKIEAQLRSSRGAIRYALKTDIPRKRFWTLSVWSNRSDMTLFSRSGPHRTAMMKFFEWGTDKACIAEWSSRSAKIDWEEARVRLQSPSFHYRYDEKKEEACALVG
jgi:hypothetical protein